MTSYGIYLIGIQYAAGIGRRLNCHWLWCGRFNGIGVRACVLVLCLKIDSWCQFCGTVSSSSNYAINQNSIISMCAGTEVLKSMLPNISIIQNSKRNKRRYSPNGCWCWCCCWWCCFKEFFCCFFLFWQISPLECAQISHKKPLEIDFSSFHADEEKKHGKRCAVRFLPHWPSMTRVACVSIFYTALL